MKLGPDIAPIAAAIGDPARANMLAARMHGQALTASELALEAGVAKQTASSHLAKLAETGLVCVEAQGRHRYYRLANDGVAQLLESLMGVAAHGRSLRARAGPKEPALRRARVCYDHLAGEAGVGLYDALFSEKWLRASESGIAVTRRGAEALDAFGIDLASLERGSRRVCRTCLDWSMRRAHLSGALGAALLHQFLARSWLRRRRDSRILDILPLGQAGLKRVFKLAF